ncbi:MAG TPA: enoyl-CoA hydratase/isomerase family protein [Deltaproteobacteria bacterium]|nr:enoyl-CoA hydratase/isomerase family protein [Deltaproteobacteria bacterium]HPR55390.1 enoyl-CoA hydratase/isomerase family protein [Deltaproteobacteria bacterium]HXK48248.1 enoyl-CoA hydratase/isomerase family protein [Deltaproteobacteria bacterium]
MLNERIEDGIIIATFENGKTNSITLEMLRTLRDIVRRANEDDAVKGIILTGAGRIFCSGFDLPTFLGFQTLEEIVKFFDEEEEILLELFMCKKPVVSVMNGAAVAGGLIFAMATDYRIVKNHPKISIGMSEIKLGLPLSLAQSGIMRFGYDSDKKFTDLMYFGRMLDVNTAKELAIVDEVVEEDQLIPRAKEVIKTWIDNPGRAFIKLKEALKKPVADRIRERIRTENWQDTLNCFFDKDVRGALEFVRSMM